MAQKLRGTARSSPHFHLFSGDVTDVTLVPLSELTVPAVDSVRGAAPLGYGWAGGRVEASFEAWTSQPYAPAPVVVVPGPTGLALSTCTKLYGSEKWLMLLCVVSMLNSLAFI